MKKSEIAKITLILVALALGYIAWSVGLPWRNGSWEDLILRGADAPLETHVAFASWFAAIVNIFICVILFASAKLWADDDESKGEAIVWPRDNLADILQIKKDDATSTFAKVLRGKGVFISVTLVSLTLAGIFWWQKMSTSLWIDEDSTLRFHTHGNFRRGAEFQSDKFDSRADGTKWDARVVFNATPWRDIFWGYTTTNNHFLFSILTRISLDMWRKISFSKEIAQDKNHPARSYFSETFFRLPSFIFGIFGIILWAILLRRLGFPIAALAFVVIYAWHPWHGRYMTEARGYSMTLCFLALCIFCLVNALRQEKLRYWIGLAASQIALIYTWPGMLAHALLFNVACLILLIRKFGFPKNPHANKAFFRWLFSGLLTGIVLIQLISPCLIQLYGYLQEIAVMLPMQSVWYKRVAGFLIAGMDWQNHYADFNLTNPVYSSLETLRVYGVSAVKFLPILYLLVFVGFIRLFLHDLGRFIYLAVLAPAVVLQLYAASRGQYMFFWYYYYLSPLVIMLLAVGLVQTSRLITTVINNIFSKKTIISFICATSFSLSIITLLFTIYWEKNYKLINFPMDPMREAVAFARGGLAKYGDHKKGMARLLAHINYPATSYDPYGYDVNEAVGGTDYNPSLHRLMRWSDTLGKELHVIIGMYDDAVTSGEYEKIFKVLNNKKYFEHTNTIFSLEVINSRRKTFRYKGGVYKKR